MKLDAAEIIKAIREIYERDTFTVGELVDILTARGNKKRPDGTCHLQELREKHSQIKQLCLTQAKTQTKTTRNGEGTKRQKRNTFLYITNTFPNGEKQNKNF